MLSLQNQEIVSKLVTIPKLTSTSLKTSRMSGFLEFLFLVLPLTVLFNAFTRDLTASACGFDKLANIDVNSEVGCSRPYKTETHNQDFKKRFINDYEPINFV